MTSVGDNNQVDSSLVISCENIDNLDVGENITNETALPMHFGSHDSAQTLDTPANSYCASTGETVNANLVQFDLPSFCNKDTIQLVNQKRQDLHRRSDTTKLDYNADAANSVPEYEAGCSSVTFTPRNSLSEDITGASGLAESVCSSSLSESLSNLAGNDDILSKVEQRRRALSGEQHSEEHNNIFSSAESHTTAARESADNGNIAVNDVSLSATQLKKVIPNFSLRLDGNL